MVVENSNLELRENRALDYFQNIVETVREPLIVLDSDLRVKGASHSFYQTFNVTKEEAASRHILLLGQTEPKDKDVEVNCRIKERAANAFSKWCNGFLTNRQARGDGTVNSSGASVR